MTRWTVRASDGPTLAAILSRAAPDDPRALADGRVFLGRKRVQDPTTPVAPGDEITIAPPTEPAPDLSILARGPNWIAVDKPTGIPTIPDHAGASHSLLALVARAVGRPIDRVHPTSRLDRDVSGVVIFALDRAAADRFARAREKREYARRYVAIAARAPSPERGAWDARIGKAKDPRRRAVDGKDATDARTIYAVVARAGDCAMLALAPITGRTHQLRVHASHAGAPLLGDRVYGGPARLTLASGKVIALDRVALHCARVTLAGAPPIASPVPEGLRATWLALGGDGEAWENAASCQLAVD